MKKIIIINGPNLNLLGLRQPEIYGNQTFDDYFSSLRNDYKDIHLAYFQSNHEGDLIDKIQEVGFYYDGIILNAGGYTHTSIALRDAVLSIDTPTLEVHVTNVKEREPFRHHSYLEDVCINSIIGQGLHGYKMAIEEFLKEM